VARACSSESSDIREHFFSKDGFGVFNFVRTWKMRKQGKKTSNQAVNFRDFVNCDNNTVPTALMAVEDICDAASKDKGVRDNSDEDLDDPFNEAVSAFETKQL
jgi:hypothetical protein